MNMHLRLSYSRSLPCLAVVLLLLAQLSFASHVHEVDELVNHDCTLCHQLQSVKHLAAGGFESPAIVSASVDDDLPLRQTARQSARLLPPCRAPPEFQ